MICTILGSGCVEGHPIITKPKDFVLAGENRLRPGFLVTSNKDNVVFDIGPDIRQQLIHEKVTKISAIFVTHQHFDHLWGIADLAQLVWVKPVTFPVYVNKDTLNYIKTYFPWIKLPFEIYEYEKEYQFDEFSVIPYKVAHSQKFETAGFLIKSKDNRTVFYGPDFKGFWGGKNITCDIAVIDGAYFFGKYIDDNDHLGSEKLKETIDLLNAKKNYLLAVAPYYYKKTSLELKKKLPSRYYLPDDFTSFRL